MKRILENAVSLIVVMIVLLLIIPLNTFLVDVMIILNIGVSMLILLISMNIKEPLEFSIFPSLLLITTLFRIGINVSTTRSILGRKPRKDVRNIRKKLISTDPWMVPPRS